MLINHLLLILKELQEDKNAKTELTDDYYNYLLSSLEKENQELTKTLIHYLTLLNKTFREQERGIYQSSHEDVVLALELVQDLIKPKSILTKKEQTQLEELEQIYLTETFTRKEVQELLNVSKSQTHRLLMKLENLNLIHKELAPKNQSHIYRFGTQNIELRDLFSDNENIEFSDIR